MRFNITHVRKKITILLMFALLHSHISVDLLHIHDDFHNTETRRLYLKLEFTYANQKEKKNFSCIFSLPRPFKHCAFEPSSHLPVFSDICLPLTFML